MGAEQRSSLGGTLSPWPDQATWAQVVTLWVWAKKHYYLLWEWRFQSSPKAGRHWNPTYPEWIALMEHPKPLDDTPVSSELSIKAELPSFQEKVVQCSCDTQRFPRAQEILTVSEKMDNLDLTSSKPETPASQSVPLREWKVWPKPRKHSGYVYLANSY